MISFLFPLAGRAEEDEEAGGVGGGLAGGWLTFLPIIMHAWLNMIIITRGVQKTIAYVKTTIIVILV